MNCPLSAATASNSSLAPASSAIKQRSARTGTVAPVHKTDPRIRQIMYNICKAIGVYSLNSCATLFVIHSFLAQHATFKCKFVLLWIVLYSKRLFILKASANESLHKMEIATIFSSLPNVYPNEAAS